LKTSSTTGIVTELFSVFQSFLLSVAVSSVIILVTLLLWSINRNRYWKNLNVPYVPSTPIFGTFKDVLFGRMTIYDASVKMFNNRQVKNIPFYGIFMFLKPVLIITEPELIKRIMVTDFHHFSNCHSSSQHKTDAIGFYHMFFLKNPLWKQIRVKLSPVFTSGKMKAMYYLVDNINKSLLKLIKGNVDRRQPEMELKEMTACYTIDVSDLGQPSFQAGNKFQFP
jgi:cytochrome P450 family 6